MVDAICTVITAVEMKHDDDTKARQEWMRLAKKMGVEIVEREDLLAARKRAQAAQAMAEFGGGDD